MSGYDSSRWADKEFSGAYADNADDVIMERGRLIDVLKSFYGTFLAGRQNVTTLDLGCGDGTLTLELVKSYGNLIPTLADGSADMLVRARTLLDGVGGASFVQASFQDMLAGGVELGAFDLIFSSLAIHHLDTAQKAAFYGYVHEHTEEGGYFVNIDVVLPPSDELEKWYLATWRRWAEDRRKKSGKAEDAPDFSIQYKKNPDNKPDTLGSQLDMLKAAGFRDVDCYYKNGIFSVFGGRRHGA